MPQPLQEQSCSTTAQIHLNVDRKDKLHQANGQAFCHPPKILQFAKVKDQ
jgi:hypothetical protein